MQSKTAFVLLGILKEKPMNPYEIVKILEKLNISQWSSISSSSVYATIRILERNGQISGEKFRTSAMPEKTVYTVTQAGITAFLKALREYLGKDIPDITKFNLSTLFLCHLEKQDALHILRERAELISENIKATEETYRACQKQPVPEYALSSLVHNINFYNAELSSVRVIQEEIEKTGDWQHFLTGGLDG